MRKLATLTLICLYTLVGYAQNLRISPVHLPELVDFGGRANCIFQDKTGFIWFGKETGLFRYDGNELKAFRHELSNPLSISVNYVNAIIEDSTGDLWIGTKGGGLNHYHRKTETFSHYIHDKNNPNSISFDEVTAICPDGNGNLLIGTDGGGLNLFNPKTKMFQHFTFGQNKNTSYSESNILQIEPDGRGKYWLATWGNGVLLYDSETNNIEQVGEGTSFQKINVFCVKEVAPGILWIAACENGLLSYNVKKKQLSTIVDNGKFNNFIDIKVSAKGQIYVATFCGLLYFPSITSNYQPVTSPIIDFMSMNRVFIDRTQTIWLATRGEPIGMISSFRKKFHTLPGSLPFSGSTIKSIVASKQPNLIYLRVDNNLLEYNLITHQYKSFNVPLKYISSITELPKLNTVLFSGTEGLFSYSKTTGQTSTLSFKGNNTAEILKQGIYSLYPADSLGVWIAAYDGVYKINFDVKSNSWNIERDQRLGINQGATKAHYHTCFLQHPNGDFWVGTFGGGVNYKAAGKSRFSFFRHELAKDKSLSDNYIGCMEADRAGNVWIGTQSGLNKFDRQTQTFNNLHITDGLSDDWVLSIATDSKNRAWIGTRRGISCVSPDFKTIKNYDIADGLPNNEFISRSVSTDGAGNIYFGSKQGIVWFHPDSIVDNPFLATPAIVNFKLRQTKVNISANSPLQQSIELASEIKLNSKQSSFSFQLAALSYFNPKRNRIKYKLIGYDKDWQFTGANQIAEYVDIPWGTYTFTVMAANDDGVWNPSEKNIKISIAKPVWLSNSAILLYFIILSITGLYLFLAFSRKQQAMLNNNQEEVPKIFNPNFTQPSNIDVEPADKKFMQKALAIIEENMSDPEFGVHQFADKMCLSRQHVYRKINTVTGISVAEYIKVVRLNRAAQLLSQKSGSISEIAYQVGFNDRKYFSKCFRQQFGVSPAQFAANNENFEAPTLAEE